MHARLGRSDEACPEPHAVSPRRKCCRHRSPGADAACCQHRHVNRPDHLVEQRQCRDGTANMSACLHALRNDEVASRPGSRDRLLPRPNLPAGQCATRVHHLYQPPLRLAVEKLDDLRRTCSDLDALQVKGRAR